MATIQITGVLVLSLFVLSENVPVELRSDLNWPSSEAVVRKRSPTLDDRPSCQGGIDPPANRVNTTERLRLLRRQMDAAKIQAYIITSDNAHQSEMVSSRDHRRQYISGFSGSAGTAVVTASVSALWTDGRYFIQAEQQLDCNWILMKQGERGVPSITEWLTEVLKSDDRVAADPTLVGAETWLDWNDKLNAIIQLDPLSTNLIDQIWDENSGRPPANKEPAFIHPLLYSGVSWQDKLENLRAEFTKSNVEAMVVTALDEVAWLLNVRGSDIPNEPMLLAYLFVSFDQIILFVDPDKITADVHVHLNSSDCRANENSVMIRPYEQFISELPDLISSSAKVLVPKKYSYTGGSSFAVYNAVPESKRVMKTSPLLLMKAKKNDVEAKGMLNAHLKDAVALCDCVSQIEQEVSKGIFWDELKVSESLLSYRSQQEGNRGASFETIGGFGSNGAIIHYTPSEETNAVIDNSSLLLLDSGGQYLDGTTDVTRTFHFGEPTVEQMTAYTLVLKGHVDLARSVIPRSAKDTRIDILARKDLFQNGLDYRHGTGHGIGSYLSVHESPTYIGLGGLEENKFEENYFFSDEPGYYKSGQYGIRIESILRVVPAVFNTEFANQFYRFDPVTLVPFERKLIRVELLNFEQVNWINNYHGLIHDKVGKELLQQNRKRAYEWLIDRTECIGDSCN